MSAPFPRTPNGLEEIVAAYGDPWRFMGDDGAMGKSEELLWEEHIRLTRVPLPHAIPLSWGKPGAGQVAETIRVHGAAAEAFDRVLQELYRNQGLWSQIHDYGGTYMFRPKRGDGELSTHSWGIAIDLNVRENPLGAKPTMPPDIVAAFEFHGFTWGGRFGRPDGMHFQLAGPKY